MPIILQDIVYPIRNVRLPIKNRILDIEKLEIGGGEFVGVIDAGDGGSSVLGKMICGLLKPEFGSVSVTDSSGGRAASAVFLECECEKSFYEASAEKEAYRYLRHSGKNRDEMADAVKRAVELTGLDYERIKSTSPFKLPRCDRRMLALTALLAAESDIVVLNDPMRDMDALWCGRLMEILKRINDKGTTVILISSDPSRMSEYADRVIIMKDGRIAVDASAKNVFSEYYSLIHLGIPVPDVRKCCHMLRERGIEMPNNIILYEQFIDRLKILMWRKNK